MAINTFVTQSEALALNQQVYNSVKNEEITSSTFLTFDFPESVINLQVEGTELPIDITDTRTTVDLIATFRHGDVFLFKAKVIAKIQGHGSTKLPKKGYSFKFLNKENEKLYIKWGNTVVSDSANIKAFFTDPTHSRDLGSSRLWHRIRTNRPFPSSFIADFDNVNSEYNKDYLYQDDALFYTEAFPMRMTFNGEFEGLYSWKMKKKVENYRMDENNKNNIFLDTDGTTLRWTEYRPSDWEVRSPKMEGYEEGGIVPDPIVQESLDRIFAWVKGCLNNTIDMRATYQDYLNLDSAIDYMIACEVIGHWDSNSNNNEFMTWDGLVWSWCIYDCDQTMGVGFGMREDPNKFILKYPIWLKLKSVFEVELKARYKQLREDGIVDMNSIYQIYKQVPSIVGADLYDEDLTKWGWRIDDDSYSSLKGILDFAQQKLDYIDSFWIE